MKNGVQEGNVVMRQCFRVFMVIYLGKYFSRNVKTREDRYDIMCALYASDQQKINVNCCNDILMVDGLYQTIQI